MGPLLTFDLAGEDTVYAVAKYLFPLISDSHELPLALKKIVEAGELGMKTCKGIFDYSQEEWDRIVKQRDKEFLQRLKLLYWSREEG
ncbi:MAG: 3-hydroxyacyl-CoA dehydrogenase family protein [Chloroflexota bacterium]|nr:3-hydroxyacyl-CoA dehydrogenase family protein [Chloroflexota bacterium]